MERRARTRAHRQGREAIRHADRTGEGRDSEAGIAGPSADGRRQEADGRRQKAVGRKTMTRRRDGEMRRQGGQSRSMPPVSVSPFLPIFFLLLTAHCSLLTAFAQPGVPQPNSPLYGGGGNSGQASTGLPPVLKKVGIDQHLNEQLPLDAVFKDEQGTEVRLGQFFNGKPV